MFLLKCQRTYGITVITIKPCVFIPYWECASACVPMCTLQNKLPAKQQSLTDGNAWA